MKVLKAIKNSSNQSERQIDRPLYCWAINYSNYYKHIELEVIGNIYENPEVLEEN